MVEVVAVVVLTDFFLALAASVEEESVLVLSDVLEALVVLVPAAVVVAVDVLDVDEEDNLVAVLVTEAAPPRLVLADFVDGVFATEDAVVDDEEVLLFEPVVEVDEDEMDDLLETVAFDAVTPTDDRLDAAVVLATELLELADFSSYNLA
jgi:hypothetical protein